MSSSKKIDLSRDFPAGVYLSEAHNPIPPPPLHTVCIHTGMGVGGGGELNQRKGGDGQEGEYRLQSWLENTNMTDCISSL